MMDGEFDESEAATISMSFRGLVWPTCVHLV
jgi:hypothetical protein